MHNEYTYQILIFIKIKLVVKNFGKRTRSIYYRRINSVGLWKKLIELGWWPWISFQIKY